MNEAKAKAIEEGEAAGEAYAGRIFEKEGVAAMAKTLASETWEQDALTALFDEGHDVHDLHVLTASERVHPYYLKAFCEVFARGARRYAEMVVRGAVDGRVGRPVDGFEAETRKRSLGNRPKLIAGYDAGHAIGAAELAAAAKPEEVSRGE
jgi:hypothetical protein